MSERIITLFGEEIAQEQVKPVEKSRFKKKTTDKNEVIPENNTVNHTPDTHNSVLPFFSEEHTPVVIPTSQSQIAENNAVIEEKEEVGEPLSVIEEKQHAPGKGKSAGKKMKLPDDWIGKKQYYTIGEVAELFQVKTSNIRFWTNEFKIKVRTTPRGDRLYTAAQIREIRTIHHLVKERGFTLAGAKAKLAAPDSVDVQTVDLRKSLLQLRNKLMAIKNQLK